MLKNKGRSLFTLSLINAIIAAFSYILTLSLVRYFGPNSFGQYSHILLLSGFLMLLSIFGTEQTSAVIFARNSSFASLFSTIHFSRIFFSIITIFLFVVYLFLSKNLHLLIVVLLTFCPFFNFGYIYELSSRNERFSFISLIEKLSYIILSFIFLLFNILTVKIIFLLMFFTNFSSLIFQFYDNKFLIKSFKICSITEIKSIFYLNLPIVIVSLSLFVYGGFSRLFLESSLGTLMLGKYSACWQIISIATIFQSQVSKVWRPSLTKAILNNNNIELLQNFKSYFFLSILPNILLCIFISLFTEKIIMVMFGSSYLDLTTTLSYFGFYFCVISFASLIDILWISLKKTLVYMLIQLSNSVLLLSYFFINSKNMKIVDFARVTVLSHFFLCVVLFFLWYYFYNKNLNKTVPLSNLNF